LLGLDQHLQRRVLEVEHAAEIERHDLRLCRRDQRPDFLADALGVEEEQTPFGPQQQQPGKGLVVRMLRRERPEDVRPALAAEHVDGRVGHLLRESDDRHDNRHQNALERAEQDHAEERGQRPQEFRATDAQDADKVAGLDQADRVDDHRARQHRVRHQADEGRQQEHRQQGHRRRYQRGNVRLRTGHAIDRGLRHPAARRHRAGERSGKVAHTGR
jgi:hypothetical protein